MLQIAVYNQRQHAQWRLASSRVVLALGAISQRWVPVEQLRGETASEFVEFAAVDGGLQIARDAALGRATTGGDSGSQFPLPLPAVLQIEGTRFEVADVGSLRSQSHEPLERLDAAEFADQRDSRRGGPAPATVGRWLDALATLHRHPASEKQFFEEAAAFAVDPVGLDGGIVLLKNQGAWQIAGSHLPRPELGVSVDETLLEQMSRERTTMFRAVRDDAPTSKNDRVKYAVVVAPVFGEADEVVGAVYGFRTIHETNKRRGVRYLEAQLVDLVAKSVATGLARMDRETQLVERRSALAQRLPANVVKQVELDDQLLVGQQGEVTVLFADLRDFSELCARLDTRRTYHLLNNVMDCLTDAVLEQQGTIIDYYGDGLAAMWNAPVGQSDHASRATRAALRMVETLPAVAQQWQRDLQRPLRIGVGLHTGSAIVGNIGSSQHLKYGPRGATVNLASRIETATKTLGTSVIASTATQQLLGDEFLTYRLCEAQLKGIDAPIDLYAVERPTSNRARLERIEAYSTALSHYENGASAEACRLLDEQLVAGGGPGAFLLEVIQKDCSRRLGRRASDNVPSCGSAIPLKPS